MTHAVRRRHPAVKALIVGAALFLVGAGYSLLAPATQVRADDTTSTQVDQGKALFAVSCSSCHGLNGEGTGQGPNLKGVGTASVDFQMSTGRMPLAQPGVQPPKKPNTFTREEIDAIAAYVDSLAPGGIPIPEAAKYDTAGLSAEEIARGGEIFRSNCSACHNFGGYGGALPNGKYAPGLIETDPVQVYEAIRVGPANMPKFSESSLSDSDVREVIAYLQQFHAQPSNGGFSLGGIGPVAEGLWAWIAGMGSLVLFAVWIAAKGARSE